MGTQAAVVKFEWEIEKFNRRLLKAPTDFNLYSSIFSFKNGLSGSFQLNVWRRSTNCSFYLICNGFERHGEFKLYSDFLVKNAAGEVLKSTDKFFEINKKRHSAYPSYFFFSIELDELKNFMGCDTVFICIELKHEFLDVGKQFLKRMGKLYLEGISDLKIKAGGKEFKASKFILMSHSEVFKTMFLFANSIEAKTGTIKIEDFSANVVEAFINWTHLFELNNFDSIASDLYRIAHKYDVGLLMNECLRFMCDNIALENLPAYLRLAYKYEEEIFKQRIIEFLRSDPKILCQLTASDEWFDFHSNNRELVKKILFDIHG